jgi:hypothetical protein
VQAHALIVEAARRRIPVNSYLAALHHAICTGLMPNMAPGTGEIDPTSGNQLSTDQRVEAIRFMLELAVPQLKRVSPPAVDSSAEVVRDVAKDPSSTPTDVKQSIRLMSTEQLRDAIITLESPTETSGGTVPQRTGEAGLFGVHTVPEA